MSKETSTVLIVDDDTQLLKYMAALLRSVGLNVRTFASTDDFLKYEIQEIPCCIVLDVRMPGISGIDLHERLIEKGIDVPVIFMTAYATVHMSVEAMKEGAMDFLEKPFEDQVLIDAIHHALRTSRAALKEKSESAEIINRFKTLTEREREVFRLVAGGLLNKQIAYELGISEKTVKIHRGRIMHKMGAASLAHLVKMWQKFAADRTNV